MIFIRFLVSILRFLPKKKSLEGFENLHMKKKLRLGLGELFCGPGGIALGAKHATENLYDLGCEIQHVWANDYDFDTCKTYAMNFCNGDQSSVICEDVRKLNISTLKQIDCFAFGFPCNDFSMVGEQKGLNGNFGPLYTYGVNIIQQFKPKFFLAENVGGLTNVNQKVAFEKIITDLRNAGNGYNLTVHLYKSEDYGVPQSRHRIIIVGFDQKLKKIFKVPAPLTKGNYRTAMEAIENPPIPLNARNNELTRQGHQVIERLKFIKPGENVWNANLPDDLKLNVKGAKLSHIYRRLDPNKPSYTITGSGGGGTHVYHWSEPRALTNRERARLQTFPDDFIFYGSKESVRKQIGMAVPPQLSKIIFESIIKTYLNIEYKNINACFNI